MNLADVQKAEEIRQRIKQLENFINYKRSPLDKVLIIKQEPKFKLAIKTRFFFDGKNYGNNIGKFIRRYQESVEANN